MLPAATNLTCSASAQSIHEITHQSWWPGTRAAHVITGRFYYLNNYQILEHVYTKSGWWDPSWDYFKTWSVWCSV